MPDADPVAAVNALTGAAFGAAGQRCMALSVIVFVGDSIKLRDQILEQAKGLKVGGGEEADTDIGPVISTAAKERIERLIASGVSQGAELLMDGRGVTVPGYEKGNFVGATMLGNVTTEMDCYQARDWSSSIFSLYTVFQIPYVE
jgi:malonate-semialdehyde dehydrogenase (acetylating)/methylmalonate-semialdehyde dehydrogenase